MAERWCLFLACFAVLTLLSLPVYCDESDLDKVSSTSDTIGSDIIGQPQGETDYDDNEEEEYEDNDEWYYDPQNKKPASSTPTVNSDSLPDEDYDDEMPVHEVEPSVGKTQIDSPTFNEGVVSIEDVKAKKSLPAPKTTIILYTVLIIVLIAAVVLISVWKGPFRFNKRPVAITNRAPQIIVHSGEEGKRLLDHPFV